MPPIIRWEPDSERWEVVEGSLVLYDAPMLADAEAWVTEGRSEDARRPATRAMRHRRSGGYLSSKPVEDLAPPPRGPAPGAKRRADQ